MERLMPSSYAMAAILAITAVAHSSPRRGEICALSRSPRRGFRPRPAPRGPPGCYDRPMRTDRRKAFGCSGEGLAFGYLLARGYRVRERNWRFGRGEVDLICEDGAADRFR